MQKILLKFYEININWLFEKDLRVYKMIMLGDNFSKHQNQVSLSLNEASFPVFDSFIHAVEVSLSQ